MHSVTSHLLHCLWLYSGYPVKSRGPTGLMLDAIEKLDPEIAGRIREGEVVSDLLEELEAKEEAYEPHRYCHFCGECYVLGDMKWPKTCEACGASIWKNPLPVAVLIVPVKGGLLAVRRNHEPKTGQLALPSGYIESGETWQEAAVRELQEETGIKVDSYAVQLFEVVSALNRDTLLIFCRVPPVEKIPKFEPNAEVSELVTLTEPIELAFTTHTNVVRRILRGANV